MRITSLKNHMLVALPALRDPCFQSSVVYIIEHDSEGAIGFIINKTTNIFLDELLEKIELTSVVEERASHVPVMIGGPVRPDQLFVLFSEKNSTVAENILTLPSTSSFMEELLRQEDLSNVCIFLGYAGWSAGQLEQELLGNHWLVMPADHDILCKVPVERRHRAAAALLGVNMTDVSMVVGHA